jgi:lysophospholipase L1-like esterase
MKKILFQGDSITDCGRLREVLVPNLSNALGRGYGHYIAGELLLKYIEKDLKFYNRGINGNRVVDLYARWKVDTINLQPDVITILIGVNDVWADRDVQNGVEPERFEAVYDMMLEWTRKVLPEVKIVLLSPFTLACGVIDNEFAAAVEKYAEAVRRLAKRYNNLYINTQAIFDEAVKKVEPSYWASDGIHPTPAGHLLIARALQIEIEKMI